MSILRSLSLALFALCISTSPTLSHAGTLTSKLTFADLPTTITLCRDISAIQALGVDEQWVVRIDADANALTGEPASGSEFALVVQTIPQALPCLPTSEGTADALVGGVLEWDGNLFQLIEPLQVDLDFNAHTMALSADTSGILAGLSAASRFVATALASYKPTPGSATFAGNTTASTTLGNPIIDASGNVQQCSTPCSAAAPYYPIIDIVGFDPGSLAPAYGPNKLTFEFDVAGLPASIGLCLFPNAFASDGPNVDRLWLTAIDIDHDGALDVAVVANTTPQEQDCTTHTEPTATSVVAGLYTIEPPGTLVYDSDLPVSIDSNLGRITVQAPRTDPLFAGLSADSVLTQSTAVYYGAEYTFARDAGPSFALGGSFNDPAYDLSPCSGNCSIAEAWYVHVDLVGGAVYVPDGIFHAGFE